MKEIHPKVAMVPTKRMLIILIRPINMTSSTNMMSTILSKSLSIVWMRNHLDKFLLFPVLDPKVKEVFNTVKSKRRSLMINRWTN